MGRYGNVVLVTGASSGIGKAVAEYLAQKGYKVYGTSRKCRGGEAGCRSFGAGGAGDDENAGAERDAGNNAGNSAESGYRICGAWNGRENAGTNGGIDGPGGVADAGTGNAGDMRKNAGNTGVGDTSGGLPGNDGQGENQGMPANVSMIRMDVRSEESVRAAVEKVIAREGELGILVNNAGIGIAGSVEDTAPEEAMMQFDTNFFGAHRVIRQVLPIMRRQKKGMIVNISSMAAVFPVPYQAMYSASKAALEGMSASLRNELRPFGIKVAVVEPGDMKTGFTGNRVFVKNGGEKSAYSKFADKAVAIMERDELNGPEPAIVAKVVAKIIERRNPPPCVAVGMRYKVLSFIKRLVPRSLELYIVSKMYGG